MHVFAKLPFAYAGKNLDRGEITELKGARNDEKLLRLRYFLPFNPKEHRALQCDMCGSKFISETNYEAHKRKVACIAPQGEPTKYETAELLDVDPKNLVLE